MKFKSKFFEVYIESLGLELPEYQTKHNEDDSRECFIPACLDAAYKIVLKNTSDVMIAFVIKVDGRSIFSRGACFISPKSTETVIGFDAGRKVEGLKVIEEAHEFIFGRPQVQNGAVNNNNIATSSGTIEVVVHPASFLREEERKVQASNVEVANVSGRRLNELTMKHFTDGEKVATKAGAKKQVYSFSVDKEAKRKYSIYDVDYRRTIAKAVFKYRDLYSLLQKNIIPTKELRDLVANNSNLLRLFNDHYEISDKLKYIEEQELHVSKSPVKATRRLLKDLKELKMNPLPTIAASPLSDNLLLWHANLHGTKGSPFEGLTFHLELLFNEHYPFEPPRVQMLSFLAHSNVIHGFICLDMLVSGDFVADQNKAYTGWSSAYSLLSVLLQLQAFLFDRANMTEESIAAAKFHQQRFSCACGHCQSRPWPVHNNQEALPENEKMVNTNAPVIAPVNKPTKKTTPTTKATTSKPRWTGASAKLTLKNVISKPSWVMKAMRCNPKAIILPILAAAAIPNIYKHASKYTVSMEEINSAMLKGVEKLTQIKSETLQSLPTMSSMSFSISPNLVFTLKIFGLIICIGLVQWLFIAASAQTRNQKYRDEEAKLHRAQLDVKLRKKAEKERKLAKQLQKAKENQAKDFNGRLRHYYDDDIDTTSTFKEDPPVVLNKGLLNNNYIVPEQDEFFESPAKLKKEQKREARLKAFLKATTTPVKPSNMPKKGNYNNNGVQIDRKTGRPIRKSKFARNSNTIKRDWGSEVVSPAEDSQSKNRYSVHDESTEESFMEKQLILMNHSLIDMMRSTNKVKNNTEASSTKKSMALFSSMPNEILLEIFSYLNHSQLMSIARVSSTFRTIAFDGFLWDRRELMCFHSKATFEEDVLGVGLNVAYYPDSDRLSAITSPLDLLSHTAYSRDKVRTSVWKTPFQFFLPLCTFALNTNLIVNLTDELDINRKHGQNAIPLVNESLADLLRRPFEPLMALEVFPKLMNTMVVELMDRKLHASMKALEGFCFFHRLLIEYTLRYPEVLEKVESTIENFINDRRARTKKAVPNLGEFLTLLTVSQKYNWEDVCDVYIEEQLVRNVKWVVQALPNWNKDFDNLSKDNASQQFLNSTQVSQRLLIFNYYFLKDVAKPRMSHGDVNYIKQNYDLHYGKPSLTIRNEFHNAVKYIQKLDISQWSVFFHHLGLGAPSRNTIYQWIVQARKISALRRYHK